MADIVCKLLMLIIGIPFILVWTVLIGPFYLFGCIVDARRRMLNFCRQPKEQRSHDEIADHDAGRAARNPRRAGPQAI